MNRVVVIGAGYWGKNLVRNFAELDALHGICDLDEGRARDLALAHSVPIYRTLPDVCRDPHVHAVAIAVPAQLHFDIAAEALDAGKHCFVEKPLVLTLEHAFRLRDLAAARRLTLMVGHILEHHPAIRKLAEIITAGTLGRIHFLHSTRLNFGRVRLAENALWELGVHDISVILRLLDEYPSSVTCSGGAFLRPDIADTAYANLYFPSGAQAGLAVSWLYPQKEQRLVVVGSKAMAVFDDTHPDNKLRLYHARVEWIDGLPVTNRPEADTIPFEPVEPLKAECRHFLHCVTSGDTPLTDAEDAIRVLRVLTACQASLQERGAPKPLDGPLSPDP